MKKVIAFLSVLICSVSLMFSWTIDIPHRILEVGLEAGAGISNNTLKAVDFLKKDVVVDPVKIENDVPKDGFIIDIDTFANTFFNLNLKNGFHVGAKTGIDVYGNMMISKELFDFFANGIDMDQEIKVNGDVEGDVFFYTDASVGWNYGKFHFNVRPALVKPLMHVQAKKMKGSFVNGVDGSIDSKLAIKMEMNTCVDMDSFFDNDVSANDIISSFGNSWGFDVEMSVERQIIEKLQGMAYMRLPIVPGKLEYSTVMESSMTYYVESVKDCCDSGAPSPNWENKDKVFSKKDMYLCRPFKMGVKIAWRPLGKWSSLDGMLGFGVKYPWSNDARFYMEYGLSAYASLANILGLRLTSGYYDEIFKHEIGLVLNFRAFEMNTGISARGGDFVNSFKGSGIGAYVSFCFGW